MNKAKKALKEAIRDKMQGHILEAIGVNSLSGKDIPIDRTVFDELCLMDEDCTKCNEYRKGELVCAQGALQLNSLSSKDLKGRGASEKSITPKGGGVA